MIKTLFMLFMLFSLTILMAACTGDADESELNVAIHSSPASLDSDLFTTQLINDIMSHVYESLFEFNERYEAIPHLAESYEIIDDGRTYAVTLRRGVRFHDGSEMTSADVVASFRRWLTMNNAGRNMADFIESFTAVGDYQVNFTFYEPHAPFLQIIAANFANQKFFIRPQWLVEAYPDTELQQHVGTGPFQLEEFLQDQHVLLRRFEDYVPNPGVASGMSGRRTAEVDWLRFVVVPEQAVRIAGIQSDQFQFAFEIPSDQYPLLAADDRVQTFIISPSRQLYLVLNMGGDILSDKKVRQAIAIGLDKEELAGIAIGSSDFWSLNPSHFGPASPWHVPNAGAGIYNAADVERARQLLAESSYDGSPIVILNQRENMLFSQTAIALHSQLENIGFAVDLQLLDEATVVERRGQRENWDIHASAFFPPIPDPQFYGSWMGTNRWLGNWNDEYSLMMDEIFERMLREVDLQARQAIVEEWHDFYYLTVPFVKIVDFDILIIASSTPTGFASYSSPFFWNVRF